METLEMILYNGLVLALPSHLGDDLLPLGKSLLK